MGLILLDTHFYTDWRMHAIYCDGTPAGFLLYDSVAHDEPGHYGIYRFMVAHERQGQGIDRRALRLLLDELRARPTHAASRSATSRTTWRRGACTSLAVSPRSASTPMAR